MFFELNVCANYKVISLCMSENCVTVIQHNFRGGKDLCKLDDKYLHMTYASLALF